ncbi:MAG: TadE family protein [Pirellulales bacterium]
MRRKKGRRVPWRAAAEREASRSAGRRIAVRRAGLAPVEFVLWLPVLLFVMALMVNYGTMAAWRIRGEIAAHDAGWRTRWPRTGGGEPDVVKTTAVVTRVESLHDAAPMPHLDPPAIQAPVVRGPLPNGFVVNQVLDPLPGAVNGNSHVERQYPLLSKIGSYESGPINDFLLHGSRTNGEMGIPNRFRRTKVLYQLPQTSPNLPQAFRDAVVQAVTIPHYQYLSVLDRDHDWLEYRGYAPDFHPRVHVRCTLEHKEVYDKEVSRLIDVYDWNKMKWDLGEISHLPSRLTSQFLAMYKQTLAAFEAELMNDPPPPPPRVAYLTQHIAILKTKIAQLEKFQKKIPGFEQGLVNRPPPMM